MGKLRNMTSIYLCRDDKFLLLYRMGSKVIGNSYTGTAGGHMEESELNNPRACVLRELQEEIGLTEQDVENVKFRYITLRLKDGEIRQNYYFFGKLKEDRELGSTEGTLRWVKEEEFPELPMPLSAKHMILHYLKEGRFTDHVYCGITEKSCTRFVPMADFEG